MKTSAEKILNSLFLKYPQLGGIRQNITDSIELAAKSFASGNKLLVCGNGGSAADSEHIAGELMKGFVLRRELSDKQQARIKSRFPHHADYLIANLQQALPAISLVSQTSLCTAIANDNSSDFIFAQQVLGYGKEGDILLAISTSGTSKNIVYAAETAKASGMSVIALTGESGGTLKDICDILVNVPETEPYKVQELHLPYYHTFCLTLEQEFFGE
ncbi:MAG: SIS domain-containing protein [Chitinispirillia bacterium]|nr:SIS domain-containing protein [Chitinispirillia bacterium]MCL2241189.1 SIS domain-containing protein [Chitinispirillia bacterium]